MEPLEGAHGEAVEMALALGRMASLELELVEPVAQVRTVMEVLWHYYGDLWRNEDIAEIDVI